MDDVTDKAYSPMRVRQQRRKSSASKNATSRVFVCQRVAPTPQPYAKNGKVHIPLFHYVSPIAGCQDATRYSGTIARTDCSVSSNYNTLCSPIVIRQPDQMPGLAHSDTPHRRRRSVSGLYLGFQKLAIARQEPIPVTMVSRVSVPYPRQ
ncbi:hypothetical protein BJX68DRAFT_242075 [Aspergillus pseudodeflectus]|uniref:Uncharacterized protein n=1 Tax=Aspergillus pseudodeflectus TaxID=176178 RepID=A0ABR4JZX9_9EURO